ncbi:MAG: phage holin family protein [Candidatus Gracilibacteria bacterium]|jgi:putative membrane protein
MRFILSLLLSAFAVFVTAYLVPGVYVDGLMTALIVAVVLAVLNATLGLFLKFIMAPLNWLTLGLVSLVINIFMVRVTDSFMFGFATNGFWAAAVFALVLAIIQSFIGIKK